MAACAMHRVDPGLVSAQRIEDPDRAVRARACRTAGEIGASELVSKLASAAAEDEDSECRGWAAWSAVLLGARQNARALLQTIAMGSTPLASQAARLWILSSSVTDANAMLLALAQASANPRLLIRRIGYAGDPAYVPWLIGHMADDKLARLAGESFSMITGADLAWLDLERPPPDGFEGGPIPTSIRIRMTDCHGRIKERSSSGGTQMHSDL